MSTLLRLVAGYLRHRPLAAALAIGLLALGVALLSLLALLDRQLDRQFARNLAGVDLVLGAKGSPLQLVTSSLYHADAPTGNVPVSAVRAFGRPGHPLIASAVPLALGDSYAGRRIVGTTVDSFLALYDARLADGRSASRARDVVAGANAAQRLGLEPGSRFASVHGLLDNPDLVHAGAEELTVTGVLAPTGLVVDELLLTDVTTVWEAHHHGPGHDAPHDHDAPHNHDHHEIRPEPPPWHEARDREITALLATFSARNTATLNFARNVNENTDLLAAAPAVVMAQFGARVAGAERVLTALGTVIGVAAVAGLFVILLNALRERRSDLSLLRALGARPRFVFGLVLAEGVLLAVIGVAFGLLASRLGLAAIAGMLADRYAVGMLDYGPHERELAVAAAALAAAVLAAAYPAFRAYRIDPGVQA